MLVFWASYLSEPKTKKSTVHQVLTTRQKLWVYMGSRLLRVARGKQETVQARALRAQKATRANALLELA